jgi:hypothetical protein
MDNQRRYEVKNIAERLDKLVIELNDLADEEESAFDSRPVGSQWSVSGQDSKEAFEEMRAAADKISMEIEELRRVAEVRPKFQSGG